jgi:hypothetical protein
VVLIPLEQKRGFAYVIHYGRQYRIAASRRLRALLRCYGEHAWPTILILPKPKIRRSRLREAEVAAEAVAAIVAAAAA